jgi:hypothetical protein
MLIVSILYSFVCMYYKGIGHMNTVRSIDSFERLRVFLEKILSNATGFLFLCIRYSFKKTWNQND